MKIHHWRYHSPDRRPDVATPIDLEYECTCGATRSMGQGQYHTLDGKKPIAFTTNAEKAESDTGESK